MTKRDPLGHVEQRAIAEEVASLLRHDLRNRLGTIRNSNHFLRKKVETTDLLAREPRVGRFFELVETEVVAADELIGRTIGPRAGAAEPAPISVRTCLDLAMTAMRCEAAIEVEDDGGATVHAEAEELALAIRALLENAAEASSHVFVRLKGGSLTVRDEGQGFAPDTVEQAVAPFFTTKPGHVGFGLGIARRIARRGGGELTIESSANGCVHLVLPVSAP